MMSLGAGALKFSWGAGPKASSREEVYMTSGNHPLSSPLTGTATLKKFSGYTC